MDLLIDKNNSYKNHLFSFDVALKYKKKTEGLSEKNKYLEYFFKSKYLFSIKKIEKGKFYKCIINLLYIFLMKFVYYNRDRQCLLFHIVNKKKCVNNFFVRLDLVVSISCT